MLVTGFPISLVLWAVIAYASLQGSLKLYRDGGLAEKWLLIVPFLFATLVFTALRYRLLLWAFDRQALHELFSIGSYPKADTIAFFVCLPVFYMISVLRPQWVVRVSVNLPLLLLLPFLIKLALYFSGVAPWDAHDALLMPVRGE